MARTAAVGKQNFKRIIEEDYFYVDKTSFIKEWWENGDDVTLITRPRRFGKTLMMSMVEQFFSVQYAGMGSLFEGLFIWNEEKYRKLQGTYPVISLSFAGIKAQTYEEVYADICRLIARLYRSFVFLLEHESFLPSDRNPFFRIMEGNADAGEIKFSLSLLSEMLYRYYKKRVIILLDEYDTPMQEAYSNGYWEALADFTRSLFNFTCKTNPYLERAVMTGITRVSRESVFSDLNNLEVVTTTSEKYETSFGFTQEEVSAALEEFGLQDKEGGVKLWYDGFRFGSCDNIYNPWSIINFLGKKKFKPYWVNTSSNKLVSRLIQEGSPALKIAMEDLLLRKTVPALIDEEIVFDQLDDDEAAVWSLLLAGGYLKIAGCIECGGEDGCLQQQYELALTNLEVVQMFRKMMHEWFSDKKSGYNAFVKALLAGDTGAMNRYMNQIAFHTFSSFDAGKKPSEAAEPERFYHGFVLGLISDLKDKYAVTSNRESGYGRYDVMLEPKSSGNDGIIIEFKVNDPKTEGSLQDTAKAAVRQILEKQYAGALEAKGIARERIRVYGFAFSGKNVWIDGGCLK